VTDELTLSDALELAKLQRDELRDENSDALRRLGRAHDEADKYQLRALDAERSRGAIKAQLATLRTAAECVVDALLDPARLYDAGENLIDTLDSIGQVDTNETSGMSKSTPRETFDPALVRELMEAVNANATAYDAGDNCPFGDWVDMCNKAAAVRESEHTPSQPAAASYPAEKVEALMRSADLAADRLRRHDYEALPDDLDAAIEAVRVAREPKP